MERNRHDFTALLVTCVFLNIATLVVTDSPDYGDYYVDAYCGMSDRILGFSVDNGYGYLNAAMDGYYRERMDCSVTIAANDPDDRITLRFTKMDIYKPYSYCYEDYLIMSGASSNRTFCGYGLPVGSYYSTSNRLTFRFVSGGNSNINRVGFRLYFTIYRKGECVSSEEHQCGTVDGERRCITEDVTCDGRDNCGDWSDESNSVCGLSTGAIVAISLVCTVVGLCLIAALFYCIYSHGMLQKSNRRRQTTPDTVYSVEPSTAMTSAPAYSEPPPAYTYINTSYSGAQSYPGAPPSYVSEPSTGSEIRVVTVSSANTTSTPGQAENVYDQISISTSRGFTESGV